MSYPTLSVRVAFASNPYDSTLTWTEIGPASGAGPAGAGWVRKIATKRGRERLLRTMAQFQAGTATVTLDNRDRRFDPLNTSGPYYPNVEPEKVIQVGATWQGTFYPIWTGYADDWPQNWPGFTDGEVPVLATDYFKALSYYRILSSGYTTQVAADGATNLWRLAEPPQVAGGPTVYAVDSIGDETGNYEGTCGLGDTAPMPQDPSTSVNLMPSGSSPLGWVNIPPPASSPLTTFSVEAWVYSPAWSDGADGNYILNWVTSVDSGGFTVIYNTHVSISPSGIFSCEVDDTSGNYFSASTNTAVGAGAWHHVVATVDASRTITLYVDGQVAASTPHSSGTVSGAFTPQYLAIGAFAGLPPSPAFAGSIADVAFYTGVVLTTAQVANHYKLGAFPAQYSGQYVDQALDVLGFPTGLRKVDTGHTWCQADTQSEVSTRALMFLQRMEQTEQGQFFMGADGSAIFQDRYHRYTSPGADSLATFGDGGAAYPDELPYAMGGIVVNFDRSELYNEAPVTRRGGNLQDYVNTTSATKYGNRVVQGGLSDLMMDSDADALYCAEWIVADTAYPQIRLGELVLEPHLDDRLWPHVLGRDIGDVITVNKHRIPGGGPELSVVARIEGITHSIDPPYGWRTVWNVSVDGTKPWMILSDPVMGFFDQGNRLGW